MLKRSFALLILVLVSLITSCTTLTSEAVQEVSSVKDKLTFIDFYSDECPNCMMMIPIVQGFETRYGDQMTFKFLNIDMDGKALYDSMGLRGNPIFLIVKPDNTVVYKGYGRVPELALDKAIRAAIGV
jgi:thiol-disulfide isomerase/thioredoxin